jgi:hypothetical protein
MTYGIKGFVRNKPIQLREKSLPENRCIITGNSSQMTYIRKIFIPFLENLTFFSVRKKIVARLLL